jgi:biopolymer transport protein TolR
VDLPSVGKSSQRPDKVIEVIVGKDEKLKLKINGDAEERSLALGDLRERVLQAQDGNANVPVVISADRQVKYESVVQVMDRLQRAGVQRVGLSVKQGG